MMKSGRVAGCIGAVAKLQHAKVVLPVCASGVISVDSRTAAAKLAPTSLGMLSLETFIFANSFLEAANPLVPEIT